MKLARVSDAGSLARSRRTDRPKVTRHHILCAAIYIAGESRHSAVRWEELPAVAKGLRRVMGEAPPAVP